MPTSAVCRGIPTSTTTCSPATGCGSTTSRRRCPRSASTATSRTWSRSPAQASASAAAWILHRYGLGSWQRGREVIWSKALAALQVPIYHTIHGRGICEPGAGRWLDSRTFVFNESVVANEEGLRQLGSMLETLGVELVGTHSPGWYDSIGEGSIGTSHMDMVCLVPERARDRARTASRELRLRALADGARLPDRRGAARRVLGPRRERRHAQAAGKVVINRGSPNVVEALERAEVEVIQVDFSESQRFAIAGLHCATLELVRDQVWTD